MSTLPPESDDQEASAEPAPSEAAQPEAPQPAPTQRHGEIVEALGDALGDGLVAHAYSATEAWVRIAPAAWLEAGRVCKERLGLSYLCFISAIDWKLNPDLSGEKLWDPDATVSTPTDDGPGAWHTGVAGGETRFQVFARLGDVVRHVALTLKVDVGDDAPSAQSWVPLFRGADWHEREAWEMYGIDFVGHPGLRHLYLPGEFEGHPLRKDFPMLAREVKPWPGLVNVEGLPGADDGGDEETAAAEVEVS